MADFRRARWGLRRTFQTEQAVEGLSVFDNVLMVHENTASDRSSRRGEVVEALAFVGLDGVANHKVGVLGARERRLVEVARAVTGKPAGCPAGRAGGRASRRRDRAPGPSHLEHSGAFRRSRDPRRPRHEPRLGLLPDHCRARLRQADRVGPDGRGAARRARDARLPRNRGGSVSAPAATSVASARRGLSVPRGSRIVVREVSLDIPTGEVTTLLGPNGAGKSTLVLAVAGVLAPDGRPRPARRRRSHAPAARADSRAPAWPSCPRAAGCCPSSRSRTTSASRPTRSAGGGRERYRVRARALPRAEEALGCPGPLPVRRRAADGGARAGARVASRDPARRRALARARAGHRQAPRAHARRRLPSRASASSSSSSSRTWRSGSRRTAYVLEGGRIRYHGTAAELRENPELLHSAYLLRDAPSVDGGLERPAGAEERNRGPDGPLLGGSRPAEPAAQPPGSRPRSRPEAAVTPLAGTNSPPSLSEPS